jgi:hypothetical protein
MSKKLDLIGKVFTRLTVIEEIPERANDKSVMWRCRCECGNFTAASSRHLNHKQIQSCGCLHKDNTPKLIKGESSFNKLYGSYKLRSKRKKIPFDLDKEQFKMLVTDVCHYCGSKPLQEYGDNSCNGKFMYNGIDRLDSKKGYTSNNSVTCCKMCNYAKLTSSKDQFLNWIEKVYKYNFNHE